MNRKHADYSTPARLYLPRSVTLKDGSSATIRVYNPATDDTSRRKLFHRVPLAGGDNEAAFRAKLVMQSFGAGVILSAFQGDSMIGLRVIGGSTDREFGMCSLSELRVHPDFEDRGVARQLFEVTKSIAISCPDSLRYLVLAVDKDNTRAQERFRHFGFEFVTRETPGFELMWTDPVRLAMAYKLPDNLLRL